jgi:hypothetical protein
MRELMRDFEALKKAFERDSPEMHIDLPAALRHLTVADTVEQGELIITK